MSRVYNVTLRLSGEPSHMFYRTQCTGTHSKKYNTYLQKEMLKAKLIQPTDNSTGSQRLKTAKQMQPKKHDKRQGR